MNLKEAKEQNKLSQFIKEREGQKPGDRRKFNRAVKAMAGGKSKPNLGTSVSGSHGG
jgi:hypothetical protein